jgi:RNA polymerase sigma-70 factor, ECF subfamily
MAVSDTSLVELISRSADGDSVALRTLYEQTSPQLFSVLLRILQRADLAEEALQEVFVSIWRRGAMFNAQRGRPMAWLIGIARNRAIDVRRQRRHEYSSQELTEDEDTLVTEHADLSEEAGLSLDAQRLSDCMQHLSTQQDQCIRLAFLNGLSHEEIAQRLTSPLGSVKSWIRRGLRALKDCLVA